MIAGRYELQSEIGRGGMGAVWRARDTLLDRDVALKRMGGVGTADGPDRERAHREALLAARLNHAHMVSVFDLAQDDDGWTWLVMEYVPGITLSDAIAEGPLQPRAVARIGQQVAEALSAAHAAGITHRDVKPSNILITEDGRAKLSDFGIARSEHDSALTRTGEVVGSPAYLPPEVARGATSGPAGDMWSLGATLFHAASGQKPYVTGDGNAMGVLFRIVQDPPPRLPAEHPLSEVVGQLMTFEPEGRPAAAAAAVSLAVVAGDPRPLSAPEPAPDPAATAFVAPVPAAAPPGESTQVIAPVPVAPVSVPLTGDDEPEEERRSGPPPWVYAVVAVLAVAVIVLLAFAVFGGDDDSTDDPPPTTPTEAPTTTPSETETPTPTPTPSETPTPTPTPTPTQTTPPPTTAPPTTAPPTTPPPTTTPPTTPVDPADPAGQVGLPPLPSSG